MNTATAFARAYIAQIDALLTLPFVAKSDPVVHSLTDLRHWVNAYAETVDSVCEGFDVGSSSPVTVPNPLAHLVLRGAAAQVRASAERARDRLQDLILQIANETEAGLNARNDDSILDVLTNGMLTNLEIKARSVEVQLLARSAGWLEESAIVLENLGFAVLNQALAEALSSARAKAQEATDKVVEQLVTGVEQVARGARTTRDIGELAGMLLSGFGAGRFRARQPQQTPAGESPSPPPAEPTRAEPAAPVPDPTFTSETPVGATPPEAATATEPAPESKDDSADALSDAASAEPASKIIARAPGAGAPAAGKRPSRRKNEPGQGPNQQD